ncbi:NAD(P)-binding protein [Nocardia sp. R6R-6]|uniref:NAD(P)-binding protein n=1 Tax=Nocardia sp. R6R-6 TaxID=3459303 RepID=UPI00403DC495
MIFELPVSGTPVEVDFDPEKVRLKFAEERAKRLRADSVHQFDGLTDTATIDSTDPWSVPFERSPVAETVEVAVLGGGFGGLLAGAHLRKNGIDDFRIIEEGGDFGGTWYWNRYPGLECDVESYMYLPLLEDTGYIPTKRFVSGTEVLEHAQRIGRHFDLYRTALFQTTVTEARWLDEKSRWRISTHRGDTIEARFLLRANGPLNKPQIPRVPGIGTFRGKIMHTTRWDYGYTGGGPDGGLDRLGDKIVAIVGTGATGVQAVPHLAASAKKLYVVQRTPTNVAARRNRPTDPEWAAPLEAGWQDARIDNFVRITNGFPQDVDLVDDAWTSITTTAAGQHLVDIPVTSLPPADRAALAEISDMQRVLRTHKLIDALVEDPDTAAALKPWYGVMCKRPCFNDHYYRAFNSDSVELVHSPAGLERVTESGFVVDGVHHEVDCLIFATGFETGSSTASRYGYDIVGRAGISMREHFAEGHRTLHGFFAREFPNYVEIGLSQNAFAISFVYMLDRKARHAARLIAYANEHGIVSLEPTLAAQDAWVATTRQALQSRLPYFTTCTPGFYNGQGELARSFFADIYNGTEVEYWDMIENWWRQGTFEGLELRSGRAGDQR